MKQEIKDQIRIDVMKRRAKSKIPAFADAAKAALEGYRNPTTKPLVEKAWREIFDSAELDYKNSQSMTIL